MGVPFLKCWKMNESLLSPNTCCFAKVAAIFSCKEARKKLTSNEGHKGNSAFLELRFKISKDVCKSREDVYNVDFRHFNKKIVKLEPAITHWNSRNLDDRKKFSETLAVEEWKTLPIHKKRKHTLSSCKGCQQSYGMYNPLIQLNQTFLRRCKMQTLTKCQSSGQ